MGQLRYPAPDTRRTAHGLTVHTWEHQQPLSGPIILIHGFASNTLFNWVKTGWLDPLMETGRSVISVDLPGHGASRDVDPTGLSMDEVLTDLHRLTSEMGPHTAVHGYSLGSRVAWQFAHAHPGSVAHLVIGGSPVTAEAYHVDPAQARAWAAGGSEPADELTRGYITVAAMTPGQNLPHVVELRLALGADLIPPEETVPSVPTLVVAGGNDEIAAGSEQMAQWVRQAGQPARFVELPGRNHVNALTSRDYKGAVTDFLRS
ncbi:alpha/beta fold hydrolase [Nesterenkonia muleiensis]|uniref:alpha/beta fold hydrolase n=1 Tax=Nesterenkonia muleiensis TaxID=2282648 RepID=UPI000E77032A|nr:alpha/beta hydrolase [Nesterenkonia muleiensis]